MSQSISLARNREGRRAAGGTEPVARRPSHSTDSPAALLSLQRAEICRCLPKAQRSRPLPAGRRADVQRRRAFSAGAAVQYAICVPVLLDSFYNSDVWMSSVSKFLRVVCFRLFAALSGSLPGAFPLSSGRFVSPLRTAAIVGRFLFGISTARFPC